MGYSWRTREDGVVVTRDGNGDEFILTLTGEEARVMDRVIERWGELSERVGQRHGIPGAWVRAMIKRESNGDEHARNPERLIGREDDGVGLLQITSGALKAGHTDAELEDPEINLEIGVGYMAALVKRYGHDFPKISAAFNSGSVHPPYRGFENPWGMHAWYGHITEEVSALNYDILRPLSDADRATFTSLEFKTVTDYLQHDFERAEDAPPTQREGKPKA